MRSVRSFPPNDCSCRRTSAVRLRRGRHIALEYQSCVDRRNFAISESRARLSRAKPGPTVAAPTTTVGCRSLWTSTRGGSWEGVGIHWLNDANHVAIELELPGGPDGRPHGTLLWTWASRPSDRHGPARAALGPFPLDSTRMQRSGEVGFSAREGAAPEASSSGRPAARGVRPRHWPPVPPRRADDDSRRPSRQRSGLSERDAPACPQAFSGVHTQLHPTLRL